MFDLRHHFGQVRCGTVNPPKHLHPATMWRTHEQLRTQTWRYTCASMQIGLAHTRGLRHSLRNCAVSKEKRPPTSPASTTSRALPPLPARGVLVSLSRRACLGNPVFLMCPRSGSTIAANGTHECRVHCQLGTIEQRESVNNDFQPPANQQPPTPRSKSRRKTFVRPSACFSKNAGRCSL